MEQLFLLDGKRFLDQWSENKEDETLSLNLGDMFQTEVSLLEQTDQLYVNVVGDSSKELHTIKSFITSI